MIILTVGMPQLFSYVLTTGVTSNPCPVVEFLAMFSGILSLFNNRDVRRSKLSSCAGQTCLPLITPVSRTHSLSHLSIYYIQRVIRLPKIRLDCN